MEATQVITNTGMR